MASIFCIPWGPGPPPLAPLDAAEAGGGCPATAQPWCLTTRGLTIPQFLVGYTLVSIGYSLGVTLIQTIFSKVLGPRPQVRMSRVCSSMDHSGQKMRFQSIGLGT